MSILTRVSSITQATRSHEDTLDEILQKLLDYGQPRVGVYNSDGLWHCSCDMNTRTVGAQFKCSSSFDHLTPLSAARECLDRVLQAVSQYRT